ncbi:MAG TPA: EamA family transporter [Spirochaetia bacterium]|nr:EamA family transporter [Spirochaetia bacterium]
MRDSSRTYFALTITVLIWGLSFIATKEALRSLHPFAIVFFRFAIASVVFGVILMRQGFPRLSPREHLKLAVLSVFEPGIYFFCETFGLQLTTASIASLIIAAVPLVVVVFAGFLLKEQVRARNLTAVALSIVGIAVLIFGDARAFVPGAGSITGDLLIVGAVITASLYTVLARDLGRTRSALEITSLQIFYGAVIFAPFFFATLDRTDWKAVRPSAALSVLFLALCATVLAYLFFNFSLTRLSATRASIFINGIPVVTTVAGWLLLGEKLTLLQLAGGLVVLVAVYINSTGWKGTVAETSLPGEYSNQPD